jgi:predicted phosphoribosyltransferase
MRAPSQPELAVGAISEDGAVHINELGQSVLHLTADHLIRERNYQLGEIARRKRLFRAIRPAASITGRSVIVTDDGLATGSTMIAALRTVRTHSPHELIVAVPVAPPERLAEVRRLCDDVVCLLAPTDFRAVGQFYEDFSAVEDEQAVDLLGEFVSFPPQDEEDSTLAMAGS